MVCMVKVSRDVAQGIADHRRCVMAARNIRVTTSDFANMRNDQAVYVDKTRLIYGAYGGHNLFI